MSRITTEECCFSDIEWYGIDKNGNIAVFCSGGAGNLPEFVCADKEKTDKIIAYFAELEKITDSTLFFRSTPTAQQVARDFSDKGLYYFDSDDGTGHDFTVLQSYYTKHSAPHSPLNYKQLPPFVQQLLKDNFLDAYDFSSADVVYAEHAYE